MPAVNVRLFGQISVACDDQAVEDLIPGKAKELFCYLLLRRQHPVARESLATVLWEDCTTEHSKQYLRKALWQLQRSMRAPAQPANSLLQVNAQWVAINPAVGIRLDIEEFENTCNAAQCPSWWRSGCPPAVLQAALDLYRGDLMEGCYRDWCLNERERLQNIYLVTLERFVTYCDASGEYGKGLHYSERILHCDRAHEVAHQHMMRLLYRAGDRAGALRQYERCAAALQEELGVQPSAGTRRLYQQISGDHLLPRVAPDDNSSPSGERLSLLQSAFGRLQDVKTTLDTLQATIEDTLSQIRKGLHPPLHTPSSPEDTPQ